MILRRTFNLCKVYRLTSVYILGMPLKALFEKNPVELDWKKNKTINTKQVI